MLERFRGALTFANVTAVVALVFAMGGGAYAITSIPGRNGAIHGCYLKNTGSLRVVPAGRRCRKAEKPIVWNQKGVQGVTGLQGPAGLKGDTGAPGAQGTAGAPGTARAYGWVEGVTFSRSKNIVGVTQDGTGIFCVKLAAGIDPSTTGAVVTLDHATDSTSFGDNQPQAFAEVRSDAVDCPGGDQIDVYTGVRTVTTSAGNVTDVKNSLANEDFFIVVP